MNRNAFTLIEVMISVVIISVVIATLLQLRGNTTYNFSNILNEAKLRQVSSFILSNDKYGFSKEKSNLNNLLYDFNLDRDLRKELKSQKIKIEYKELKTQSILEDFGIMIGTTTLKGFNYSISLVRLKAR